MSAHGAYSSPFSEVENIVLRKVKMAAQTHLSPQMAHDARAAVHLDRATDALAVQLRTDLFRHQVDAQTVRVPFSKTGTVESAAPRPAFAAITLLAVILGAITASLGLFVVAGAAALAGVIVYAANPPRDVSLTVEGEAVVERELFNAFPDATIVYPESLGDVWLPMQESRSYIDFKDAA